MATAVTLDQEITRMGQSVFIGRDCILKMPEFAINDRIGTSLPTEQDLYTESATQLYPIGSQLEKESWKYRYSKSVAALTRGRLHFNSFRAPGLGGNNANVGFEGAPAANIAANDTTFTIADTAALKNEYEGAILQAFGAVNFDVYRIIGNDVSNGTTTKLYIGAPGFKVAHSTSVGITVYLNPYIGLTNALDSGYSTAMGFAGYTVTSGRFFWMKTAGPIFPATNSTFMGQTAYQRDAFVHQDGSVEGVTATTYLYQRIGYMMYGTSNSYGDTMLMLQLDQ